MSPSGRKPPKSYNLTLFCVCRIPEPDLTPEERDARTVFCMQLSARIRPRDLEEFFSSVGKVSFNSHNQHCKPYVLETLSDVKVIVQFAEIIKSNTSKDIETSNCVIPLSSVNRSMMFVLSQTIKLGAPRE